MANVLIEEQTMSDIAAAIREKNGTENTYRPSEMPQAIRDISSEGSDNYFNTGRYMTSFLGIFDSAKLPETFTFDFSKSIVSKISLQNSFRGLSKVLRTIIIKGDTSKITNYLNAFRNRGGITEIKILDENGKECAINSQNVTSFTDTFYCCESLTHIRFVKETIKISLSFAQSPLLTDESIQSIFDGLADLTGEDSRVLTLNKALEEKITDEQKAYVVSKNWQLAFSS